MNPNPSRYVIVRPVDPAHFMPVPGRALDQPLANGGEPVDRFDAYWMMALADGSVVEVEDGFSPRDDYEAFSRPDWHDDDERAVAGVRVFVEALLGPDERGLDKDLRARFGAMDHLMTFLAHLSAKQSITGQANAVAAVVAAAYALGVHRGSVATRSNLPPLAELEAALKSKNARDAGNTPKKIPWYPNARSLLATALIEQPDGSKASLARYIITHWKHGEWPKLPGQEAVENFVERETISALPPE